MKGVRHKIFFYLAIALFCISLALPGMTIDTSGTISQTFGIYILLFGWVAMNSGNFAWAANLLFILAFTWRSKSSRYRDAAIASGAAILVGLHAFLIESLPADEAGVTQSQVVSLNIGYYVWLASFAFFAIHFFLLYRDQHQEVVSQENKVGK